METIKRTKIVDVLKSEAFGTTVNVKGWVRTRRGSKQVNFIALNDGSTINNVQIVVDVDKLGDEFLKPITTGASISVNGILTQSQGKGQSVEIQATEIEIFGTADPATYPLQKKGHSMEFLREIAHLRPRTNTFGAVFRIRHNMAYAIHKFFHDRGFFYFHTPIITASDCEGAGQMFQVTTKNLYDLKKDENGSIIYEDDFFGKQASLTVSGQLEGELAATALGQIYTFGPTFRAENSNTPRHLAEFWMIEPEMAFADLNDNMEIETHPLEPFLPAKSKLLMLGSFPPQKKRWSMDFYYPNLNNDMWRIYGILFFNDKNHFLNSTLKSFCREQIIDFLNEKGIALFDTASSIRRLQDNASDKFLEVVEATDVAALLRQLPECKAIVTTGQKATDTLRQQFEIEEPKVGDYSEFVFEGRAMRLYRMPSSSRAYPLALDKKAAAYRIMFQDLQILR